MVIPTLVGAPIHYHLRGIDAMLGELEIIAIYGAAPLGGLTLLIAIWSFIAAPARLQAEAEELYENTAARLKKYEDEFSLQRILDIEFLSSAGYRSVGPGPSDPNVYSGFIIDDIRITNRSDKIALNLNASLYVPLETDDKELVEIKAQYRGHLWPHKLLEEVCNQEGVPPTPIITFPLMLNQQKTVMGRIVFLDQPIPAEYTKHMISFTMRGVDSNKVVIEFKDYITGSTMRVWAMSEKRQEALKRSGVTSPLE